MKRALLFVPVIILLFFVGIAAGLFLGAPPGRETGTQVTEDPEKSPRYAFSYRHANWSDYVDMESIQVTPGYEGKKGLCFTYIADIVTVIEENGKKSHVLSRQTFRLASDKNASPEFWDSAKGCYRLFPYYAERSIKDFIEKNGYTAYVGEYEPRLYHAFKVIYEKDTGKPFRDGMRGKSL